MLRKVCGALVILAVNAVPAWAQAAPKPDPAAANSASWILILLGVLVVYFAFLMIYVVRRRKFQKAVIDVTLRLAEERNQLARQQLALQAETNRLLERLIAERGQG